MSTTNNALPNERMSLLLLLCAGGFRWLQEIGARLRLHTWMFNGQFDPILEELLRGCMSSGISDIDLSDSYYLDITFNNTTNLRAWNANKYYAWLRDGKLNTYSWRDGRPSARTMIELRDMVIAHLRAKNDPVGHAKIILARAACT
jgi:hypothetical protein